MVVTTPSPVDQVVQAKVKNDYSEALDERTQREENIVLQSHLFASRLYWYICRDLEEDQIQWIYLLRELFKYMISVR